MGNDGASPSAAAPAYDKTRSEGASVSVVGASRTDSAPHHVLKLQAISGPNWDSSVRAHDASPSDSASPNCSATDQSISHDVATGSTIGAGCDHNLLLDLPVEVLLTHVFPRLCDRDIAAMRRVSSGLRAVVSHRHPFFLRRGAAEYLVSVESASKQYPATIPREHTLVNLSDFKHVFHLASLRGLRALDLYWSRRFTNGDLEVLGTAAALRLSHSGITDLYALRNVEVLQLSHLHALESLAPLANGRLRFFYMSDCPRVSDTHGLEGVHTVYIAGVVSNLAPLARSKCVAVFRVADDADISVLAGVEYLSLHGSFSDVSSLASVKFLSLSHCKDVRDVSALGGADVLSLDGCPVEDVSALAKVHRLSLQRTPVHDVSMLGGLYELDISRCHRIKDISALSTVKVLNTFACTGLPIGLQRSDGFPLPISAYVNSRFSWEQHAGFCPFNFGRGAPRATRDFRASNVGAGSTSVR